jgi:hypothetical protein
MPRTIPFLLRLTPTENDAIERALSAYRKKTGGNITRSDVGRHGLRQFCEAVGVSWPDSDAEQSAEGASGG